jgi:plastocyanin
MPVRMRARRGALAMVTLLAASCSSSASERGVVSATSGQRFDPATITVQVDDTVTFNNESDEAHSVTAYESGIPPDAEYFSSGNLSGEKEARNDVARTLLEEGDVYRVTFGRKGTYEYFCIPHEQQGMKGTVVVEDTAE